MKEIGTYKERTLHAFLKSYFEEDPRNTEVEIGPYIADICRGNEIIEIQTKGFYKLKDKLAYYLPNHKVTVVHPVTRRKWLIWVDSVTGAISQKRKSPKTGKPYELFRELYSVANYIGNDNFSIKLLMIDTEEYRDLCGYANGGKKGSRRLERIPVECGEVYDFVTADDYRQLVPDGLPAEFKVDDFRKLTGLSSRFSYSAVNVLLRLGIVREVRKEGRTRIFCVT